MDNSEADKQIDQLLRSFERLPTISSPDGWEQSLMSKLPASPDSSTSFPAAWVVSLIAIALINVGFIVASVMSNRGADRNAELQIVSKALLVNPVSINH